MSICSPAYSRKKEKKKTQKRWGGEHRTENLKYVGQRERKWSSILSLHLERRRVREQKGVYNEMAFKKEEQTAWS